MKIENAKGRQDGNSGYIRTLKNAQLGLLISRVQATVISNGTELERIIVSKSNNIKNLEEFIDKATEGTVPSGVYLCQKKILKKSRYAIEKIDPDLLIFIVEKQRICKVIELKDGDAFDTKKAQGEKEHLEQFAKEFGSKVPFVAEYYICCFNQNDKDVIMTGFKNEFSKEHIMTGKELCEILHIDYDEIRESREKDAADNFDYFINELLKIEEIRKAIADKLTR